MDISNLKLILRGLKWTGAGIAIASTAGGLFAIPLIAKELAEDFLITVAEEGVGEILGVTFETVVSEGLEVFAVEGVEGVLSSEDALMKASEVISKPLEYSFSALLTLGLGVGQVSNKILTEVQDNEYLVNNAADEAYSHVKEVVDNVPLSRLRRNKCDDVLARLDRTDGIYKAAGSRWLVEKDVDAFLEDMSNLGTAVLQDIKIKLLELGIDITRCSPLYAYA